MTSRLHPFVALALAAGLLAGCGKQQPMAALPAAVAGTLAAHAASTPADPAVTKLIADYQAVSGDDAAAFAKRDAIVAQLGDTDSDAAVNFLMGEYDKARALPADLKASHEQAIVNALAALDGYDLDSDEALLKAGRGESTASSEAYDQAMGRKRRHSSIIHFLTQPLRWMDDGIRWLYGFLNGRHPHHSGGGGHHGPGPGPAPAPGPQPAPSGSGPAPAPPAPGS